MGTGRHILVLVLFQASDRRIIAGDVAQLGERYVRNVQAGGSIPPISTIINFNALMR